MAGLRIPALSQPTPTPDCPFQMKSRQKKCHWYSLRPLVVRSYYYLHGSHQTWGCEASEGAGGAGVETKVVIIIIPLSCLGLG